MLRGGSIAGVLPMNAVCRQFRHQMLMISRISGHGHLPSSFSVVEILYALYRSMRHDPNNPLKKDRDIFILSKGHAALAHYCVLAHFGYFHQEKLITFGSFLSNLGCHADRTKVAGVEVSTGSLGHGIGVAVGIALARRINKESGRVFTLIGDGESNEGTVWEALMVAADLKLTNLTIIYDHNGSQSRCLQITNPVERFRAFGCETSEVQGHDVGLLEEEINRSGDAVRVIVAHTRKGYGSTLLSENFHEWHRKSPNVREYEILLKELG